MAWLKLWLKLGYWSDFSDREEKSVMFVLKLIELYDNEK